MDRLLHVIASPRGEHKLDAALDSSLYGLFVFGAYPAGDAQVKSTMEKVREKLWRRTPVGGLARYEGDSYLRADAGGPGKAWFVTTRWLAQHLGAKARDRRELDEALPIFEWVAAHALPSGVLAEQVHPRSNEPLSVSPLAWRMTQFWGRRGLSTGESNRSDFRED